MRGTLAHFSEKPIAFRADYLYREFRPVQDFKPIGFWLSDETDYGWKKWNEQSEHAACSIQTDFDCDTTKWIVLKTPDAINKFYKEFRFPICSIGPMQIDWPEVKKQFGGILISPYQWGLRFDHEMMWYYGWDCASACVWDLTTIKEIR